MDSLCFGPPRLDHYPDEDGQQDLQLGHQAALDALYEVDEREERALERARQAGQKAARWLREPAGRQAQHAHVQALLNAAEAVEVASGAAVVPGGDGEALDGLYRSWLLAPAVIGPAYNHDADQDRQTLPELSEAERVAAVAVCALAASMPGTVLGYCPPELDTLTSALEAAVRTTHRN
ncbi:hypothetical protein [Kitasatospora sp. NPDC090308]|uniref:hypothetical protein n=1 Tax=Kitasatospora sp. NPDC090308 TaxID=3364082 RepID=UPI003827A232